ncbi:MAG: hypothetical protein NTX33_16655 [Propionibacteriales bacterium]|nr:hypothetical protein [Propionibacteriales bacterium]
MTPSLTQQPVRVRFSLVLSIGFLVLGLLLLVTGLLIDRTPNLVLGGMFLLLGGLQVTGAAVMVSADEVQVKNALRMTVKRVPIAGLGDLRIDGLKLVRASDGLKITSISKVAARAEDIELLRSAIDAAGAPA